MLTQLRSNAKYIWLIIAVTFVGGFLVYETSGLAGRAVVTSSTIVAKVNGDEVPYLVWANASASLAQQQEQRLGRGLTLDERRQMDEQAFDELVNERLLHQEYDRRGIRVTDEEIIEAARSYPPPQFASAPELQTDGQFDPAKYQRFLASPTARQQGLLAQLESYYRTELPKQKLFAQVAGDVFVSDTRLWQIWRDSHDSVTASFVAFRPTVTNALKAAVTDAELQAYYDAHRKDFERPGRAVLSIVAISRRATAADSAATLTKIQALRQEIVRGAKFEDVASRASDDSVSGKDGGTLPRGPKGRFVPAFEDAAYKLRPGELSQPVKTDYGYHLIRVDERKGDTIAVRHILKLVRQGDSAAAATDKVADELARRAAGSEVPARFDSAAKSLGLLVSRIDVHEGRPAEYLGRQVTSASGWAFGGARPGEISDLLDDEQGYYVVRLDSLQAGGVPPIEVAREDIREILARRKARDALLPKAEALARAAATTTLEAAAKAQGLTVQRVGPFARSGQVFELGFVSEAVGAAFSVPVGTVTAPVRTDDAIYVLRPEKRVTADEMAWLTQKLVQREQVTRGMRDQRLRLFLEGLRKTAKIDDRRKQIMAAQRRQTV